MKNRDEMNKTEIYQTGYLNGYLDGYNSCKEYDERVMLTETLTYTDKVLQRRLN